MNDLKLYQEKIFENIKHIDEEGNEYWLARELAHVLEYTEWRNFTKAINKAIIACKNSNNVINNHFVEVNKMVGIGSNTKRKVKDFKLSRYACYLIVQNADSSKEVVALGQTYFAVQTRRQERLEKHYEDMTEDERRLYNRGITKRLNYNLNQTAKKSIKELEKSREKKLINKQP